MSTKGTLTKQERARYKDTAKWVSSHRYVSDTNQPLSKPDTGLFKMASYKNTRHNFVFHILSQPTFPHELDIIDKGSSLRITSTSSLKSNIVAWWMGAFKVTFPQDCFREKGNLITMRPVQGVTAQLDKRDGILRIKGKNHWDWFTANIEMVLERGSQNAAFKDELVTMIDRHLGIQGIVAEEMTAEVPASGAIKNGPGFIYMAWKVLLNDWMQQGASITIATSKLDSERLVDILLLMIRNRGSGYHLRLCIQSKCDGDTKYSQVRAVANRLIKNIQDRRRKIITKEKLKWAYENLDIAFLRFNCSFIGMVSGDDAEIMLTSACYHKRHFTVNNRDTITYNKISVSEYRKNFLDALGLSYSVINGKCVAPLQGTL